MIGAGAVVRDYHLPVLQADPSIEVAWVVDKDLDAARALASDLGAGAASESFDDAQPVDAVLVAVPVGARQAVVPAVIEMGWHALCEKPFALTVEQHRAFVEEAGRHGVHLGVGLMRRFYASTQVARLLIAEGAFGPVEEVVAGAGTILRRTGRGTDYYRGSSAASGGELSETGSHLIDQVFSACGAEGYGIDVCRQAHRGELEVETSVRGTLKLRDGSEPALSLVVSRIRDSWSGILIRCASGELRMGLMPDDQVVLYSRKGVRLASFGADGRPQDVLEAIGAQWTHFLGATGAPQASPEADTGLLTTSFIEECNARGRA